MSEFWTDLGDTVASEQTSEAHARAKVAAMAWEDYVSASATPGEREHRTEMAMERLARVVPEKDLPAARQYLASLGKTATRYCTTHDVYVGDGNADTHAGEGCNVETRQKAEGSRREAKDGGGFTKEKNDEGKWVVTDTNGNTKSTHDSEEEAQKKVDSLYDAWRARGNSKESVNTGAEGTERYQAQPSLPDHSWVTPWGSGVADTSEGALPDGPASHQQPVSDPTDINDSQRVRGSLRTASGCERCHQRGFVEVSVRQLKPGDKVYSPKFSKSKRTTKPALTVKSAEYSPQGGGRVYVDFEEGGGHRYESSHWTQAPCVCRAGTRLGAQQVPSLPASGYFEKVEDAVAYHFSIGGKGANATDLAYLMRASNASAQRQAENAAAKGRIEDRGGNKRFFPKTSMLSEAGSPGDHTLRWYENRSDPDVKPSSADADPDDSWGSQTKSRSSTADDEKKIEKGEWISEDDSGESGDSKDKGSDIRPQFKSSSRRISALDVLLAMDDDTFDEQVDGVVGAAVDETHDKTQPESIFSREAAKATPIEEGTFDPVKISDKAITALKIEANTVVQGPIDGSHSTSVTKADDGWRWTARLGTPESSRFASAQGVESDAKTARQAAEDFLRAQGITFKNLDGAQEANPVVDTNAERARSTRPRVQPKAPREPRQPGSKEVPADDVPSPAPAPDPTPVEPARPTALKREVATLARKVKADNPGLTNQRAVEIATRAVERFEAWSE